MGSVLDETTMDEHALMKTSSLIIIQFLMCSLSLFLFMDTIKKININRDFYNRNIRTCVVKWYCEFYRRKWVKNNFSYPT